MKLNPAFCLKSVRPFLSILLAVAALTGSADARADIEFHEAGMRAPRRIHADFQLSPAAVRTRSGKPNRGLINTETLRWLQSQRALFGLASITNDNFVERSLHTDSKGFSVRYVQRLDRVKISGAELVVIYDRFGRLQALNSSILSDRVLRRIPAPRPTLTPAQAELAALRSVGATASSTTDDVKHEGLFLVPERGFVLVRQVAVRMSDRPAEAYRVRVIAQGRRAGSVVDRMLISHSAVTNLYDASLTFVVPNPLYRGVKVMEGGKLTLAGRTARRLKGDEYMADVFRADANFSQVLELFKRQFGRDGFDGQGAEVNASLKVQRIGFIDFLGQKENAAWLGPWKMFAFGAGGERLGSFAEALDVVGHEFTHAVIESTSNLEYAGQSGALNEHLADVFGAIAEYEYERPSNPYLLGETTLRGEFALRAEALRNMMEPKKGLREQPETVSEIDPEFGPTCTPSNRNDNCGVHILSGVPNRAFALAARSVGWKKGLYDLYYRVMTARLRSKSDFTDFGNQMKSECPAHLTASKCGAVADAFRTVGL